MTSLPSLVTKTLLTTLNRHGLENAASRLIWPPSSSTGGCSGHLTCLCPLLFALRFSLSLQRLCFSLSVCACSKHRSLNFLSFHFWAHQLTLYLLCPDSLVIYPNRPFVNRSLNTLSHCTSVPPASHWFSFSSYTIPVCKAVFMQLWQCFIILCFDSLIKISKTKAKVR